ncbi:MAG: GNAT family N-acetyltransferase [Patescibacteria group bacterium]
MIEVRMYAEDLRETWDAFVADSRNGTLFHTRRFLSYHPEGRFEDRSLLFFAGNRLLAVLPAVSVLDGTKKSLRAHAGSTYGGLVLSPRCSAAATCDVVAALLAFLHSQNFANAEFLRLTPAPLRRRFSDDQEYALLMQGFVVSRCELGSIIDLHGFTEDTLLSAFDTECRNEARQAGRAGVTVCTSDDYGAFYPLLEATLKHRHAVKPTHTLSELRHVASLFPKAMRLFGAFHDGKLIAGMVTLDVTEQTIYTKYIAQNYAFQKMRPVNLLITEVLRHALREGKVILDLGVSMDEESPKGINEGLIAFKEGFGARPVRRESWEVRFDEVRATP